MKKQLGLFEMSARAFSFLAAWLLVAATATAQLAVSVSPVKLELKNTFAEKVESVRAVCEW